jgi:hypothetical protein
LDLGSIHAELAGDRACGHGKRAGERVSSRGTGQARRGGLVNVAAAAEIGPAARKPAGRVEHDPLAVVALLPGRHDA